MRRRMVMDASMGSDGSPDEPQMGQGRLWRHLVVGLLALVLGWLFWRSRMDWDAEMRLWRAVGDVSFVLLTLALAIGPLAVLWRPAGRLVVWRRAFGIWFALTGAYHAYLIWDGWARWSVDGLLGYQDLSAVGGPERVLVDPGFGIANLVGVVALFWTIVIAAASSDRAMRFLGARAWKHVQQYAYVVFYLVLLHASYFLFLHYELSLRSLVFQRGVPDPNWFQSWFLLVGGSLLALQAAAFIKTVWARRARRQAM